MFKAMPTHRSSRVSSHAEAPPVLAGSRSSHTCGPGLYLDDLIATGDPDDLISLLHRQAAWRGLLSRGCPPSHG
ncbi:hypothetical protein K1X12_10445 [Hyphomonas sp. WL0036]|uniref:hypothetical protein n=1 Tax=Hyphomonas sediminis TaxID=2866160 RepID=UPI001C7F1E03|nr:hypothetical protein [Hyphomonas sediminis]MBY9067321.1 hypothetical protein [Hyphomonas sediminis]